MGCSVGDSIEGGALGGVPVTLEAASGGAVASGGAANVGTASGGLTSGETLARLGGGGAAEGSVRDGTGVVAALVGGGGAPCTPNA